MCVLTLLTVLMFTSLTFVAYGCALVCYEPADDIVREMVCLKMPRVEIFFIVHPSGSRRFEFSTQAERWVWMSLLAFRTIQEWQHFRTKSPSYAGNIFVPRAICLLSKVLIATL